MNKSAKLFTFLFGLFAVIDLVAVSFDFANLEILSKPLLIPTLIGFLVSSTIPTFNNSKAFALIALSLCFVGDVVLLFAHLSNSYFIFGLLSFLLGHIFYIIFVITILQKANLKFTPLKPIILAVVIYITIFYSLLLPKIEPALSIAIILYGLVIGTMLVFVSSLGKVFSQRDFRYILLGAALFVFSDSLIAINKFLYSFHLAHLMIMITYLLAQVLIVVSLVNYFNSRTIE